MSGGIDSTTVAHLLVKDGYQIHGVYNDLGMDHSERERISVEYIAATLSIPLTIVENKGSGRLLKTFGNPAFLDGGDSIDPDPPGPVIPVEMPKRRLPDGSWQFDPETDPRAIGIYETIHPGAYVARARGIERVVIGTIADDIVNRPHFVESLDVLSRAYQLGDSMTDKASRPIKFQLPLIDKTKAEVVSLASDLGVD